VLEQCVANTLLRFSRSVMRRLNCPSDASSFSIRTKIRQQRHGDRVDRHLIILDPGAGMGEMVRGGTASAVPLPIVTFGILTLPPAERRCPDDQPARRSQTRGPELPQSLNVAFAVDSPAWRRLF